MTPPGQNYPIQEHSVLFWSIYLGIVMLATFALMILFIYEVYRTSQVVRTHEPEAVPDATAPLQSAEPRPALQHHSAA